MKRKEIIKATKKQINMIFELVHTRENLRDGMYVWQTLSNVIAIYSGENKLITMSQKKEGHMSLRCQIVLDGGRTNMHSVVDGDVKVFNRCMDIIS